jgi:hypothetical protein
MRKTIVIFALVLLFGFVTACDSDGSATARTMDDSETPGAMAGSCPCFTKDDVTNMKKNAAGVSCANYLWGLLLIYEDQNGGSGEVAAQCTTSGTDCMCLGPGSNQNFIDASLSKAATCVNILITSLVQVGTDGVPFAGCTLEPF